MGGHAPAQLDSAPWQIFSSCHIGKLLVRLLSITAKDRLTWGLNCCEGSQHRNERGVPMMTLIWQYLAFPLYEPDLPLP